MFDYYSTRSVQVNASIETRTRGWRCLAIMSGPFFNRSFSRSSSGGHILMCRRSARFSLRFCRLRARAVKYWLGYMAKRLSQAVHRVTTLAPGAIVRLWGSKRSVTINKSIRWCLLLSALGRRVKPKILQSGCDVVGEDSGWYWTAIERLRLFL